MRTMAPVTDILMSRIWNEEKGLRGLCDVAL